MRFVAVSLLTSVLLLSPSGDASPQDCVVPPEWQPRLGDRWNLDTNNNHVQDSIDALPPGEVINVILALNRCPTAADLTRLSGFGTLAYVGQFLSIVVLDDVVVADVDNLAQDPVVAEVMLDDVGTGSLDVSNPSVRVRASATYSPDTVEDRDAAIDGSGITVAVLDSGIDDGQHESLPGTKFKGGLNVIVKVSENPDDDNGHGTHVAGIIMGTGGASGTYRGIAPGADLVDVKVLNASNSGWFSDFIEGIEMVIAQNAGSSYGVQVMNISINGSEPSNGLDAFSQAVNRAVAAGIVVVVSAGNTGNNTITPPASADSAITVGAVSYQETITRTDDVIAGFSSRGPRLSDGDADPRDERKPEVVAPGTNLNSGTPPRGVLSAGFNSTSGYVRKSGTSMAAPHVAGLVALMLHNLPTATPYEIKNWLIAGAEDRGSAGWDGSYGYGLVSGVSSFDFTPVTLEYFSAEWMGSTAWLEWKITGAASSWSAFHVHRGARSGPRITPTPLSGRETYSVSDAQAPPTGTRYWLAETARTGQRSWHGPAVLPPAAIPPRETLAQNQPNPFLAGTRFEIYNVSDGEVVLRVLDLAGREVIRLIDGHHGPGALRVDWNGYDANGRRVAAGVYLYQLRTTRGTWSKKLTVLPR